MRKAMTVCASVAALAFAQTARAQDAAGFYKGKDINLILSAGPGGGYSQYARAFAPFFSAHIPGHPTIVIQNMPGGGGLRAMGYLNSVAPRDGTTLGLVHSSVPFAPLYGIKGAKFDPLKMHWIGSIDKTSAICIAWKASGVKNWHDLLDGKFIVGGTGAGSEMETIPALLNKLFGTKIKIVSGYTGGAQVYLAMERGEVNGRCGGLVSSIESTHPTWFSDKKITVPIQIALKRNPIFPNSPAVGEFAKDQHTRSVLKLALAPLGMDRPILVPPGVPMDRVEILRKAFHLAVNDPGFRAEAKKEHLEVNEVSGKKIEQILREAYALPRDVIEAANEAMKLTGSTRAE